MRDLYDLCVSIGNAFRQSVSMFCGEQSENFEQSSRKVYIGTLGDGRALFVEERLVQPFVQWLNTPEGLRWLTDIGGNEAPLLNPERTTVGRFVSQLSQQRSEASTGLSL